MLKELRTAALVLAWMTLLTGVVYPVAFTAFARTVFPRQADGSLLRDGQAIVGSELIGQSFAKPEYFWGRLSATAPSPYNSASSSGSNFGPSNPALKEAAAARIAALRAADAHVSAGQASAEQGGCGSDRSRHRFGERSRSPYFARRRRMASAAGRPFKDNVGSERARIDSPSHARATIRGARRTPRERVDSESGFGPTDPGK